MYINIIICNYCFQIVNQIRIHTYVNPVKFFLPYVVIKLKKLKILTVNYGGNEPEMEMHHCSIQSQMFNQINVHLNPAKQARSNLNDDFAYLYPKRVTFMYDVVHLC